MKVLDNICIIIHLLKYFVATKVVLYNWNLYVEPVSKNKCLVKKWLSRWFHLQESLYSLCQG